MDIDTVNNAVNQAFTTSNPGGVGTSYGQADSGLINQAVNDHPELANALSSGNVSLGYDADSGQSILINSQTGQQIGGNYIVQTTPSGGVAINLPLSNGAMVQVATGVGQNGQIAPVTASNVYNVGLNSSEGGFAGGLSNLTPAVKAAALLYGGSQLAGALGGAEEAGTSLSNVGATGANGAIDLANTPFVPTAAAGLGDLAIASDPVAANIAAGMTPAAATAAAGTALSANAPASTTLANIGGAGAAGAAGASSLGATGAGTAGATGAGTLGTIGAGTAAATGATTGATTNALGLTPLQTGLLGSAALNTVGALGTGKAISNAANTQTQAGQNVQDVLGGFYNQYAQAQQPYQNLGTGATQAITQGAPYFTHQFNAQDLAAGLAPNYDFMLQQGQGANRNLANAGGGLLSGNTLQGLNKFTQDYASNAYQNAFNNYQTQRQNIYQNLSNAAGLGQTSLGQLGQVGASLGNTYGNVTTGLAASQAGAQTAQAVNQANLLSNLGNAALVSQIAGTPGTNLNMKLA
jgi:hypothetical protein